MVRIFSHYVPIRTLFLVVLDALVLTGCVYFALAFSGLPHEPIVQDWVDTEMPKALLLASCMLTSMTAMGLYDPSTRESAGVTMIRLGIAFVVGVAVVSLAFVLLPQLQVRHDTLLFVLAVALIGSVSTRFVMVNWITPRVFQRRILVLGTGSRAATVDELVKDKATNGRVKIVGYMPAGGSQDHVPSARILAPAGSLLSAVKQHRIDEIVVAIRDRRGGALPVHDLLECRLRGVMITDLASFFERERCQLHLEALNMSWMVFGEGFRQGFVRETVKRLFDIGMSGVLLLFAMPVMVLTGILIYLEDGGPVFYRQERVGQGGRVFTILKFRSMRNDAEGDGHPRWAGTDDDRTTRIGRIIRKLRIDELPQIINVLRGDMSFVGPRPERPFFVEQLASKIPYYNARHSIKPGITGWVQVRYPYGASLDDAVEKLQYDLYYVKNHTLFLDIMVLIETVQVVLWGKGAR